VASLLSAVVGAAVLVRTLPHRGDGAETPPGV
jgi:hypothetical protein